MRKPGGSVGGRFKALVALSATAAGSNNERLIGFDKIFENIAGFKFADHGSGREFNNKITAVSTGLGTAFAAFAVIGFEMFLKAKIIKGAFA